MNTGIPKLLAQGFRQGNHPGLGHIVAIHQRRQHQPGHGGHIDECPGALLLELRRKRLTAANHTQHIDIENPLPVRHGGVFNGTGRSNTGVIHHHINTAPLLDQIVPDFLKIRQASNIALNIIALASGRIDLFLNTDALLRIDVADADFGALFGVPQCNRPTETAGPAGYEYSLCHGFPVLSDVSQRYLTAYESGRGWPSETVRSHGWRSQAYMDVFTACFRRPAPPAPAPSYQFLYLRNSRRATIARCTSSGPSARRKTRA